MRYVQFSSVFLSILLWFFSPWSYVDPRSRLDQRWRYGPLCDSLPTVKILDSLLLVQKLEEWQICPLPKIGSHTQNATLKVVSMRSDWSNIAVQFCVRARMPLVLEVLIIDCFRKWRWYVSLDNTCNMYHRRKTLEGRRDSTAQNFQKLF